MPKVPIQALFFFLVLPACNTQAPAPPPAALPARPAPLHPAFSPDSPDMRIRTGTLASGLRYYILPHKKPENRAYFGSL